MSDHDQPIAANVLDRQFVAERPNQRWVGDTTEFVIGSSAKLYLAAILDLYSRFIVGWALSAVNDRHLTLQRPRHGAEAPLPGRRPAASLRPGLHVRQRGLSHAARAARHHLFSMSRRGNCYDNAVMESWFSTVKSEEGERFESYAHAKEALFDYIEVFYNQRRRHSTLGQISPAEFERTRLWTLPEPWTHRTRPPLLEKPHRTRFPTAPTAILDTHWRTKERRATDSVNQSTESDQPSLGMAPSRVCLRQSSSTSVDRDARPRRGFC